MSNINGAGRLASTAHEQRLLMDLRLEPASGLYLSPSRLVRMNRPNIVIESPKTGRLASSRMARIESQFHDQTS